MEERLDAALPHHVYVYRRVYRHGVSRGTSTTTRQRSFLVMDQKSTENWEELGGRLWKLSGCKGIGTICALIDATTRGRSTEPPDDVDACAWWEVRPTTSLESSGGEVARDVVGLGQVVTRAQSDEVRK